MLIMGLNSFAALRFKVSAVHGHGLKIITKADLGLPPLHLWQFPCLSLTSHLTFLFDNVLINQNIDV